MKKIAIEFLVVTVAGFRVMFMLILLLFSVILLTILDILDTILRHYEPDAPYRLWETQPGQSSAKKFDDWANRKTK